MNMSKGDNGLRLIIWPAVALTSVVVACVFIVRFPENYPEKTLEFEQRITMIIDGITLPIKLARLALKQPDTRIVMPVYEARVANVSDTWHAARGADRRHEGQDIFAPKGTPVFSGTYGYVRRIDLTEVGGNIVLITGAGGRRYYYAHLDRIAEGLRVGQEVTIDSVLGFVGNTGNARTTPPHLHFGMYQSREAINPLPLMVDR